MRGQSQGSETTRPTHLNTLVVAGTVLIPPGYGLAILLSGFSVTWKLGVWWGNRKMAGAG